MLDFLKGLGIVVGGSAMVLLGCLIQCVMLGLSVLVGLWCIGWVVRLFN